MQTQTEARPSGRRKITTRMLSARASLPGSYEPTAPGKVLSAFKRAARVLGVPRRVVELIDYLVGRTQAMDWEGGEVFCWPSNDTLCDALDLGRTQIKTLIRIGQELALFEMRDAPNGRRFGIRRDGRSGPIVSAYGFNLTALAARRAEFEQIAAAHAAERAEGKRLRSAIYALRNRVLSLAELGQESGAAGDWPGVDAEARRIAGQRGDCYDPLRLNQILAELTMLHQGAADALEPGEPVDNSDAAASDKGPETVDTDPKGSEKWPSITPTNQPSIPKGNTRGTRENDGPSRPEVLARRGGTPQPIAQLINGVRVPPVESGRREKGRESALRGFVVTIDFVLRIAPSFREWIKTPNPNWRDLLEASWIIRSELGISQHAWAQACVVLGQTEAVAMMAAISARHAAGEVRSPGGLLRKMVELHGRGELRLDRTLFGLADGLKGTTH